MSKCDIPSNFEVMVDHIVDHVVKHVVDQAT